MSININTANISSIQLVEQGSDPATPAAGKRKIYVKSSGLYLIDDAGNAMQIAPDVLGTANQLLRVNSGATGVEWAGVGRVLISEQTPTGTTATFSSIPSTYTHLRIEYIARGDTAATNTGMLMYFNNDTTAGNYYSEIASATDTGITVGEADSAQIGNCAAASAAANDPGYGAIDVLYYKATTFNKSAQATSSSRRAAAQQNITTSTVYWENTAAITRIDIILAAGNFIAGSTLRLYGVY